MQSMKLIFSSLLSFSIGTASSQYHIYTDLTNLFGQQIIETQDGGLLLAGGEDCYTPGSITIEGCMFALHLVKIDASGDTLWTNRISYAGSFDHIFENTDGSFSLIGTVSDSWQCENIGIGLFGWPLIQIMNISSHGQKLNEIHLTDECEFYIADVARMNDSLFAVFGIYTKSIQWPIETEGRLFLLKNTGEIQKELIFPGDNLNKVKLLSNAGNEFKLLYVDTLRHIHMDQYDNQLNLIHQDSTIELQDSLFLSYYSISDVGQFENGDFGISFYQRENNLLKYRFFRFDHVLNQISHQLYYFTNPTNFIEDHHQNIIVCSSYDDPMTNLDLQVHYLDAYGSTLYTYNVPYPEDERPTKILRISSDQLVITGNINCCNYNDTIGPGKSFIRFESQSMTSVPEIKSDSLLS
ncbi:MAG: hypothetical protein ABJB16_18275, partial [Saprospiraceae bacterium]